MTGLERGMPDGGVTIDDLLFYLAIFEWECPERTWTGAARERRMAA